MVQELITIDYMTYFHVQSKYKPIVRIELTLHLKIKALSYLSTLTCRLISFLIQSVRKDQRSVICGTFRMCWSSLLWALLVVFLEPGSMLWISISQSIASCMSIHVLNMSGNLINFLISTPDCDHFGRHGEWKKYLATKILAKVANWRPTD